MSERQPFSDILDRSDDQAFQAIIDRQEAALGRAESGTPGPALTAETLAKWEKELDKLPGQRRSRRRLRRTVLLAAIITALLLAAAAGAYHVELLNWWERVRQEVSILTVEEDPEAIVQTWTGCHVPTEIPEGFEIAQAVNGTTAKIIEYHDTAGNRIMYYEYTSDVTLGLDKEQASALIEPNHEGAHAYEKDGKTSYYWFSEERAYVLEFDTDAVTLDAVERMAESLRTIT